MFSQLSGNNIITYYLGTVLDTAGVTSVPTQLAINIGLSVWNLLCAVVGSICIDKFGRRTGFRKLTFWKRVLKCFSNKIPVVSTVSLGLTLVINAVVAKLYTGGENSSASAAIVFLIFFFYGCYSIAWTPLSYLYPVEVLSYSIRANGLAVFQAACYLAAFFTTYVIPYAMDWSGWGFYLISAFWCFGEVAVMWIYFPETAKMTLEEVDKVFDGVRHVDLEVTTGEVTEINVDGGKGTKEDVKV